EELGDRRQLPAEAEVEPGPLAELLDSLGDEDLAALVGRDDVGDVRRREEDARAVARRALAELEPFGHALRPVVARRADVAVEIDEARVHHPRLARRAALAV